MPVWHLDREADGDLKRLAGQVPCQWRSRSSDGLGIICSLRAAATDQWC